MKKLHFIHILTIILFQSGLSYALAQDFIVKLAPKTNTLYGKNLRLENGFLKFEDIKSGNEYNLSADDVYAINFQENGHVEITQQSHTLDTIICQLDSISPSVIYYRQENQIQKSINRNEVFGIFFNEKQNVYDIKQFEQTYIRLHKPIYKNNLKIIRKNGKVVVPVKLHSIELGKANITVINNNVEMATFLNLSEIDSIILNEPLNKKSLKSNQTFLLSETNNWHSVISIQNIQNESLDINILDKSNALVCIPQKKENISGIFFFDYTTPITNYSDNKYKEFKVSPEHKNMKFDINYGMGYMLANAPEDANSETEKYIDELRAGNVLDVNLKFFPINAFGVGVKFNQFKTSNTFKTKSNTIIDDNLRVSLIGLSFTANSHFKNNKGYGYIDCSIGPIKYVNNGSVNDQKVEIKGSTVGVYFSTGIDFLITENISIGFQAGFIDGLINKFDVDGKTVDLDEPERLLRIDAVLGLKIYL